MNDIIEKASFPRDWDILKMRQCFSFGKGLSITKEDLVEEGIPVISYGQVHSKDNTGTGLSEELYRYVPDSFLKTGKSCLVQKNDFIFADTSEDYAGVGNCAFIDNDETIFAGYHSIIARPISDSIYPKYLAYLFLTDLWRDQIRANVMGIKVFSITQQLLRDTYICIPPVSEQKRIVELLDESCSKLDKIIANLERQIGLLQKYKKSLITETVTKGLDKNVEMKDTGIDCIKWIPKHWEVSKVKYLVDDSSVYPIGDGDHGLIQSDDYLPEGIPYLRVLNLTFGDGLNLDGLVYISDSMNAKIKNSQLKPGDLLIAKTGATIGKTAIVPEDIPISNTTSHVGKITLPDNRDAKYFYYVLTSTVVQDQIQDMSAMQSTRPELGIEGIKNLRVVVPPIEEQKQISTYLDKATGKIDAVVKGKRDQLDKIIMAKTATIYEYVTGKKRVKEVV